MGMETADEQGRRRQRVILKGDSNPKQFEKAFADSAEWCSFTSMISFR
jgi:hypothetical protein